MRILGRLVSLLLLVSTSVWAMPLGTSARTVIPQDIQQIISVDYRAIRSSDTAMQLKQQVLPEALKQFEVSLRGVGINPDQDVEQLTFASYRMPKQGVRIVGIAQGVFPTKAVLKKFTVKKIKPSKYHTAFLYPM